MELSKRQVFPKLATEHECTACLACENICPKQAINHFLAEDGHVYVRVDSDKCIGCFKCQNVCKTSRYCCGENDLTASDIYAAWTSNRVLRASATSGGAFAAFAETILNDGGCVIGAKLEGFECKHTVIFDKADICKLQGSKYMASSMEDVYRIISKELPIRNVLFVGLGCQCAGVIAFFENFKTDYRLYTVDLVCGGVPSRILIDKFRKQFPDVTGFTSFRSKAKYELKVNTTNGVITVSEKSLPLHGFNCGMTNRYSCYNCQFAKAHRRTDITIGDLWDSNMVPSEHAAGVSMVIAHSEYGRQLLQCSNTNSISINWKGALLHNKRTVCGHQNIYLPRLMLTNANNKLSEEQFQKIYTITMRPRNIALFSFRLYRYIRERIFSKQCAKEILTMIKAAEAERQLKKME